MENSVPDIDGEWIGFYSYGNGYSELNKLLVIPFNARIQIGINRFIGRITEETNYGGIDDDIMISGRLSGLEIEFVKIYSKEHVISGDNESLSMVSMHPNIVYYNGRYDASTEKFKGLWEIPELCEDENGIFHAVNPSGEWEMWKE